MVHVNGELMSESWSKREWYPSFVGDKEMVKPIVSCFWQLVPGRASRQYTLHQNSLLNYQGENQSKPLGTEKWPLKWCMHAHMCASITQNYIWISWSNSDGFTRVVIKKIQFTNQNTSNHLKRLRINETVTQTHEKMQVSFRTELNADRINVHW